MLPSLHLSDGTLSKKFVAMLFLDSLDLVLLFWNDFLQPFLERHLEVKFSEETNRKNAENGATGIPRSDVETVGLSVPCGTQVHTQDDYEMR